jgi:hypothetical protein
VREKLTAFSIQLTASEFEGESLEHDSEFIRRLRTHVILAYAQAVNCKLYAESIPLTASECEVESLGHDSEFIRRLRTHVILAYAQAVSCMLKAKLNE